MRITLQTTEARTALEALARVAPRRGLRTELECVRIEARSGTHVLTATDLETYLSVTVPEMDPDTSDAPDVTCVPLRPLLAFCRVAEGERVTLEAGKAGATVMATTTDGETFAQDATDADEFPAVPDVTTAQRTPYACATLDAVALRRALDQTLPATAKDAGRFAMHGLLHRITAVNGGTADPTAQYVATDGRRLHVAMFPSFGIEVSEEKGEESTILLPRTSALVLAKLLPAKYRKADPPVRVNVTHVETSNGPCSVYQWGPYVMVSRAIDGEFPHYEAVFPAQPEGFGTLDVAETVRRLKVVAVACSPGSHYVKVVPYRPDDPMAQGAGFRFSAKSPEGETSAVLKRSRVDTGAKPMGGDSDAWTGFCINPNYFVEVLEASKAETVAVVWTDRTSPIETRADGFRGILMPVELDT